MAAVVSGAGASPDDVAHGGGARPFRPVVYWYLTFRCNLSCRHCWVHASPDVDISRDLATPEALGVVEQLAEFHVSSVFLSGGEPLMRPDTIQIIEAITARGMKVGIETNGLLMGPRFMATARALQAKDLLTIAVSLDGGSAEAHEALRGRGTFAPTARRLEALKQEGVRFSIQAVLNQSNHTRLLELFELASTLAPSVTTLQLAFLNAVGRGVELSETLGLPVNHSAELLDAILRGAERCDAMVVLKVPPASLPPAHLARIRSHPRIGLSFGCQFPLLGILPTGDITVCALARGADELRFGNVRTERLRDVWVGRRMDELRERYTAAEGLEGVCGDCVWKHRCKGACRIWAYEAGGRLTAPFPLCASMADGGTFPEVYRASRHLRVLEAHGCPARST